MTVTGRSAMGHNRHFLLPFSITRNALVPPPTLSTDEKVDQTMERARKIEYLCIRHRCLTCSIYSNLGFCSSVLGNYLKNNRWKICIILQAQQLVRTSSAFQTTYVGTWLGLTVEGTRA